MKIELEQMSEENKKNAEDLEKAKKLLVKGEEIRGMLEEALVTSNRVAEEMREQTEAIRD
jgi:hypothetical protein